MGIKFNITDDTKKTMDSLLKILNKISIVGEVTYTVGLSSHSSKTPEIHMVSVMDDMMGYALGRPINVVNTLYAYGIISDSEKAVCEDLIAKLPTEISWEKM